MAAERGSNSIKTERPAGDGGAEQIRIAYFSGGKDSGATVALAHEHGEPLDIIIFSEVMFDKGISGELPEHIDFVKNRCIPLFKEWGYETKIIHSKKTYMDCFNAINRGKKVQERKGMRYGFPMAGKCLINDRCKMAAIQNYIKQFKQKEIIEYVGIAADEPKRLERLQGTNKVSLLDKYGYTEKMAFDLCRKYGLLSPIYDFAPRGGLLVLPERKRRGIEALEAESSGTMAETVRP